jgi:hypothetical protein
MNKMIKPSLPKLAVKPVYNNHPWDPKKVAVVHRWLFCRGFSIKIGINISKLA